MKTDSRNDADEEVFVHLLGTRGFYNRRFPSGLDEGVAMFEKKLHAGWGDMDFNSHMRNTAFLDKSADVRMMFFMEHGFPMEEFVRRRIGPVIRKDEIEYFREVGLLESFRVTLAVAGLAQDGSRFQLCNEYWRTDDTLIARVTSTGGWLDLTSRRLVVPPDSLNEALNSLPKTDGFRMLPSSIK